MKKPHFDQTDRMIIKWWYSNLPKTSFMRWYKKPITVAIYENCKAQKTFLCELHKTRLFNILITIIRFIERAETH